MENESDSSYIKSHFVFPYNLFLFLFFIFSFRKWFLIVILKNVFISFVNSCCFLFLSVLFLVVVMFVFFFYFSYHPLHPLSNVEILSLVYIGTIRVRYNSSISQNRSVLFLFIFVLFLFFSFFSFVEERTKIERSLIYLFIYFSIYSFVSFN